jgi:adenosine deaminase
MGSQSSLGGAQWHLGHLVASPGDLLAAVLSAVAGAPGPGGGTGSGASATMGRMSPTLDQIRGMPKVLLHDHLDGGLRPATIVELAREVGYDDLPSTDPEILGRSMTGAARRGHLELYLEPFRHTVAVMQTAEALTRVAAECAEDLAADGIIYAEVRFAPELHLDRGLRLDQVVEAVLEGFRQGSAATGIRVRALLTAMRTAARSLEIAELAVRYRDAGVVGFDIAGAEAGWPPSRHLDAFEYIQRENFHITIHAGEAFGLPSIWEAVQFCGAERLGHGVRIVDDITPGPDGTGVKLGRLATYIRDRRIPLEMCPTSNIQTGVAGTVGDHPIGLLRRLLFRVTVNTDNRLMSGVTLSSELHRVAEAFGYGWADIEWLTINAMKSAFAHFDERLDLINTVIKPAFAKVKPPAS